MIRMLIGLVLVSFVPPNFVYSAPTTAISVENGVTMVSDETETDISTEKNIEKIGEIVETSSGEVMGSEKSILNRTIYQFLGIPYARAPLGDLRFQAPQEIPQWKTVLKADKWPAMCLQPVSRKHANFPISQTTDAMDEDCLYLNIWTPTINSSAEKPVMIWLHGGTFSQGTASSEDTEGDVLASFGDVVVVTINYRLNAFGFLHMHEDEAPGNMGLHDQIMALEWVNENIERFGGDSKKITLFGQDAGAVSTGILISSPSTRVLISRAIMQSGTPMMFGFLHKQHSTTAENLASRLGCLNEVDSLEWEENEEVKKDITRCIKEQPRAILMEAIQEIFDNYPFAFYPSIGDSILPHKYRNTFERPNLHHFGSRPILMGFNKNEGPMLLHYALPELFNSGDLEFREKKFEHGEILNHLFKFQWPAPRILKNWALKTFEKIIKAERDPAIFHHELSRLIGDNMVVCPVLYNAEMLALLPNQTIYMYNFTHRSSMNPFGEWFGVPHYEEVPFVFGHPLRKDTSDDYTDEEKELSRRIMSIWTSFAREDIIPDQVGVKWPKFAQDDQKFMDLSTKKPRVGRFSEANTYERCKAFRLIMDTKGDEDVEL